jgi:hypothetical protein
MDIYSKKDLEVFNKNIKDVLKKVKKKTLSILEPTKMEIENAQKVILNYIINKKRKIYGGTALNEVIRSKNKNDVFYDDEVDLKDYDIYSPNPIEDIVNVCNILQDKKFKYVEGSEADHQGTYSVFVHFYNVLDISYVPYNVYNKIPFIEINNMIYTHPDFVRIDTFRMFTDPINSYEQRLEKQFNRFVILEKHYGIKKLNHSIPLKDLKDDLKYERNEVLDIVHTFLINNKTSIVFDLYAYNYYLEKSNILKIKNYKFKLIDLPYYQFISIDYENDVKKLCNLLNKKFPNKISSTEFYPLFQFTGDNVLIMYKDLPVAHIYHHNKQCIPYQEIEPIKYHGEKMKYSNNDFISIGTFDVIILYTMILWFGERVLGNKDIMFSYKIMLSHLVEMRQHYFKNNNVNIFDKSPFQEFNFLCKGKTISFKMAKFMRIQKRKILKQAYVWRYHPEGDRTFKTKKHSNISGKIILNSSDLKINCS